MKKEEKFFNGICSFVIIATSILTMAIITLP